MNELLANAESVAGDYDLLQEVHKTTSVNSMQPWITILKWRWLETTRHLRRP